jgi:hypothetical protein
MVSPTCSEFVSWKVSYFIKTLFFAQGFIPVSRVSAKVSWIFWYYLNVWTPLPPKVSFRINHIIEKTVLLPGYIPEDIHRGLC